MRNLYHTVPLHTKGKCLYKPRGMWTGPTSQRLTDQKVCLGCAESVSHCTTAHKRKVSVQTKRHADRSNVTTPKGPELCCCGMYGDFIILYYCITVSYCTTNMMQAISSSTLTYPTQQDLIDQNAKWDRDCTALHQLYCITVHQQSNNGILCTVT